MTKNGKKYSFEIAMYTSVCVWYFQSASWCQNTDIYGTFIASPSEQYRDVQFIVYALKILFDMTQSERMNEIEKKAFGWFEWVS